MKFAYVRPTKLHHGHEQRMALESLPIDDWYVDEKPHHGEPDWYWWDKLVRACRPGSGDEIHVSHASVIADSVPIALKRLGDITAREATLVIASTGRRYSWHPDAAQAMELAMEMAAEARRLVAKIGGDAFAKNAAVRRERQAKRWLDVERMWRDPNVGTAVVVEFAGVSRNALYKQFGARGTPRFGKTTS